MPSVGDSVTPALRVQPYGGDTLVVLVAVPPRPAGMVAAEPVDLDAEPGDEDPEVGQDWGADPFVFPSPGVWRLRWTVTGTGARVHVDTYDVAPETVDPPVGFSYASTADLAGYTGIAAGVGAERALINATREVDRITRCARFTVDAVTGLPTDAATALALMEATCELVGWWVETGDESGSRALVTSASIAGVSLSFGGRGSNGSAQAGRVGPKVFTILSNAGLTGQGPMVVDGSALLSTGPYADL